METCSSSSIVYGVALSKINLSSVPSYRRGGPLICDKSYPTDLFSIARQSIARQATVIPVVGVVEVVAAAVVAVVVQVNVSPASRLVQSAQSHQAAPVPHCP